MQEDSMGASCEYLVYLSTFSVDKKSGVGEQIVCHFLIQTVMI
jgi:hypothetical protein